MNEAEMQQVESESCNQQTPPPTTPTVSQTSLPPQKKSAERLLSLDALRGFDMLQIIGLGGVAMALSQLTDWQWIELIKPHLRHARGNGFTGHDLIFPLFVFLSGVTLGLSRKPFWELDWPARRKKYIHAVWRLFFLIFLGMIYNRAHGWGDFKGWNNPRYASVLARIVIAWFFCAMIVWHTRLRLQIPIAIGILLGYWALQTGYTGKGTINLWVDMNYQPGFKLGRMDPEGLLSHIPAIVNAMLGAFAGRWIGYEWNWYKKINIPKWISATIRAGLLGSVGLLLLKLGWLWDQKPVADAESIGTIMIWKIAGYAMLGLVPVYFGFDLWRDRKTLLPQIVIPQWQQSFCLQHTKCQFMGWPVAVWTYIWQWTKRLLGVGVLVGTGWLLLKLGEQYHFVRVNKKLWTSSFVLVTTGWGCILFAAFYLVIDGWGVSQLSWPWKAMPRYQREIGQRYPAMKSVSWPMAVFVYFWQMMRWSWRQIGGKAFAVIGANALLVYITYTMLYAYWSSISNNVFGGFYEIIDVQLVYWFEMVPNDIRFVHNLCHSIGVIAIQWLILAWLYRKHIFICI